MLKRSRRDGENTWKNSKTKTPNEPDYFDGVVSTQRQTFWRVK